MKARWQARATDPGCFPALNFLLVKSINPAMRVMLIALPQRPILKFTNAPFASLPLDAMGIRIPITNPAPRQVFEFTK